MDLTIETITPKRAAELMALNNNNRHVRKSVVATYARDMKAGNWKLTGAPIVLNGTRLLDGQHRLLACIASDVPFETAVLDDADESIHFAIDKGVKRTLSDELRWRGETDVNNLASALNLLWKYENRALLDPSICPAVSETCAFLETHPGLRDSVTQAAKIYRQIPIPQAPLSVTHYLLHNAHGEELAQVFVEKMVSGAELVAGDPLLTLRTYAANTAATRLSRPRREEWLAIVIKATNHWLLGRSLKTLRWRRVGPAAEAFPRLIGPDDVA